MKIAELQFRNRDFVLLFRGQSDDYRNKSRNTTLKPSVMRSPTPGTVPTRNALEERFGVLAQAERLLVNEFDRLKILGRDRLRRQQILRWAILQHYEVCATPLLDVTHSLRIAASFASENAGNEAYVFALGVPHLSGAITASAETGLQIVRLSSVCPPSAVRPHIQEGYLLGEYPDLSSPSQKDNYEHFEIDFGRRLIGKFRFDPARFWRNSKSFPQVPHAALYPAAGSDELRKLTDSVKAALPE